MWLLRAIGPVHGQDSFTFALEQKKTYSVGRDKECIIRFENRYVKPLQGSVIVGDWDPTNPTKPPELKWKSEPNKKGIYPSFKTINPSDPDVTSSTNLAHYDEDDLPESTQGCFLHDNKGQGILINENCWFTLHWQDLSICYDKMKDESDDVKGALRRYCISWTQTFDPSSPPNYVLSSVFRSSPECNYAVCYAVRILLPSYLRATLDRLSACWKKVADSQDSFTLPNELDPVYEPKLDTGLLNSRTVVDAWLPDERRKILFAGWKVKVLRGPKAIPPEKRWLVAMGAEYSELDVISSPLLSAADFKKRIAAWMENLDSSTQKLMMHSRVKEEMIKIGVNWNDVVVAPCVELGLILASGGICWGAVRTGGVLAYIETMTGKPTDQPDPPRAMMPPPSIAGPARLDMDTSQLPSLSMATERPDMIPSTFPEETEGRHPAATKSVNVPTTAEVTPSVPEQSPAVKKPLRKRNAAKKVDLFADMSYDGSGMDVSPSEPQPESVKPSLLSEPSQIQSANASTTGTKSRLHRRAGIESQASQYKIGVDDSYYVEQRNAERDEEIRQLYEETKAETVAGNMGPPPPKRRRGHSAETEDMTTARPSTRRRADADVADSQNDEEEEEEAVEDPIQKTLRLAREAKTNQKTSGSSAVPAGRSTRHVSSEEPEVVEPRPATSSKAMKLEPSSVKPAPSKARSTKTAEDPAPQNAPTQDPEFLQAISTASKSKKAVDELDKEFNNLRIPKPAGARSKAAAPPATLPEDHPNWNLVEGFDDEMRGNFIQVVRTNLFRKDLGKAKERARIDDGRPNFKKFKKKNIIRREPLQLFLAAPTIEDAEMGEPYWAAATQPLENLRRPNTQLVSSMPEEDDEMPLLPRSKKKRLLQDDDVDTASTAPSDGPSMPEKPSVKKKSTASTAASTRSTGHTRGKSTAKKTRAASVVSDVSSVAASTRASTRGGAKRKAVLPIEIQDSEDEVALDLGKTPASGTRAATSTLEGEPVRSSRASGRTTTTATGVRGTQGVTSTGTGTARGRRRLLVDDDDDDMDDMTLWGSKKRRL